MFKSYENKFLCELSNNKPAMQSVYISLCVMEITNEIVWDVCSSWTYVSILWGTLLLVHVNNKLCEGAKLFGYDRQSGSGNIW